MANGHPLREQIKREIMNAILRTRSEPMAQTCGDVADRIISLFEEPAPKLSALEEFMGVVR